MDNPKTIRYLNELILKYVEGTITEDELHTLEAQLRDHPEVRRYYIESRMVHSLFGGRRSAHAPQASARADSDESRHLLYELAAYEKTAPSIEIEEEQTPPPEPVRKVAHEPHRRKVSRLSVFSGLVSAAALLLLILFVKLAPQQNSLQVATVVDQMGAAWADSAVTVETGDRLWTNQLPLCLDRGIVTIHYDQGVDVVVESPAKFTIEQSGIYVEYGRLFSRVSQTGQGFTVQTPTARFVDLGTEFGVQADVNGSAELHVIKGTVRYFAGSDGAAGRLLTDNEAVRYNAVTGGTETIPVASHAFVRAIDSKTDFAWRGQMQISLADIVGGGNGFGKAPSLMGIDPATGHTAATITRDVRGSDKAYNPVPESPFIDGVFVADSGGPAGIPVTSTGQRFQCPDTEGVFTHEITVYTGDIETQHPTIPPAVFNGQKFDRSPVLMIHSNAGITFDLGAIRRALPGLDLNRFRSLGGLTEALSNEALTNLKDQPPDVGFWILVDGHIRYEKKSLTLANGPLALDIEIGPQDRFLTFVVTDGFDPDQPARGYVAHSNDFFYLIDPRLGLAERP